MTKIGIIGAGQLGQMLGFAANKLGMDCQFLDPSQDPPAAQCGNVIQAAFDDADALARLAADCNVISYEFENVPVASVRTIDSACPVYPPPAALEFAQDRLAEKRLFDSLKIPVPGYRPVDSADDLKSAARSLGLPLVVKTRRFGYDGKGQLVIRDIRDAEAVVTDLGGHRLIAEQLVHFQGEVSSIGARGIDGSIVTYPLSENRHHEGILRVSRARVDDGSLAKTACSYLYRLLQELNYVGVLALEMFVDGDRLLANEFAPRVHNSGHWTIEGASASQFENHIRAISGMPLAATTVIGFPGMVNIIGTMPQFSTSLQSSGGVLHDYGKTPRPGRKLAHVTVVGSSADDRDERLKELECALAAD